MSRTRIKICGVTRPKDAELAVELGADYLGLNFYPGSPRFLDVERARAVADRVRGRIGLVGVFVDARPGAVERIESEVGLELLQFHGDEELSALAPFSDRAIKVLRLAGPPAADLLDAWPGVWGYLIEGRHESLYGGSGEGWAYEMIGGASRGERVFIAGGLRPANVRTAIGATGAWGVDVCSGVEAAPGIKDENLMRMFFDEVRRGKG